MDATVLISVVSILASTSLGGFGLLLNYRARRATLRERLYDQQFLAGRALVGAAVAVHRQMDLFLRHHASISDHDRAWQCAMDSLEALRTLEIDLLVSFPEETLALSACLQEVGAEILMLADADAVSSTQKKHLGEATHRLVGTIRDQLGIESLSGDISQLLGTANFETAKTKLNSLRLSNSIPRP